MSNNEEEIFYSDEDTSDSELYQVCVLVNWLLKIISIIHPLQGSQGSKYFSGKPASIFTNKMWQNAGGISPENVSNTMYNTIDRLVDFF